MNKTVLIVGASGGIGSESALFFARLGWNVIINYNKGKAMAQKLSAEVSKYARNIIIKADISKYGQAENLIKESILNFGKIDVLVNCAGITNNKMLEEMSKNEIDKIINTNLSGTIYTTKLSLEVMAKQGTGTIINISSVQGVHGAACESVYAASKAGITAFSKSVASEYKLTDIRCISLELGWVDTKMTKNYSKIEKKNFVKNTKIPSKTAAQIAAEIYKIATVNF